MINSTIDTPLKFQMASSSCAVPISELPKDTPFQDFELRL